MKIIINGSIMTPIYEQIADQIKCMIRKGELRENDSLPSVRTLSKELKISALTVKKAYDALERRVYGDDPRKRNVCNSRKQRSAAGRTAQGNRKIAGTDDREGEKKRHQ